LRRRIEVVGDDAQKLAGIGEHADFPHGHWQRILAAGRQPLWQMTDAVAEDVAALGHLVFMHDGQRRILLQPRHEPAAGIVDPRPPSIIVIAEIEHGRRAGLDRHRLGGRDVVDVGRRHRKIDRPVRVRIVDDMDLGAADISREARPVGAQARQSQARGIDEPHGLASRPSQRAMRLRQHRTAKFAEHLGGPIPIGIRQRRALHRHRTHVIEPRLVARHAGHDLTQAHRSAQLPVQQGDQLPLRRQRARPFISAVLLNRSIKLVPRQVLQQAVKYSILVQHGVGSIPCLERGETLETQKNPCHVPRPPKSNRTAVGQARQ